MSEPNAGRSGDEPAEVEVDEGVEKVGADAFAEEGGDEDDEDDKEGEERDPSKPRRRKYAVWVAYVGAGYHGMQRNPGCPSIEEELERAFVKAGAIPPHLAGSFQGVKWSRSARTDKGVSATCQVVSAKIFVDPVESFPARVNEHLPGQIRILGLTRVTDGFNSRLYCDRRQYEYILPIWVFDPAVGRGRTADDVAAGEARRIAAQQRKQQQRQGGGFFGSGEQQQQQQQQQNENGGGGGADESGAGSDRLRRMRAEVANSTYEFTEAEREKLNGLLKQYCGTHNFHNYTIRVDAYSNEAQRYILSYHCPGTIEVRGQKWARLVVLGQSFMMHQIRKMVGMAVAVMRGAAPEACLQAALDPDRDFNVPMAPELGLFLDEAFFDAYNRRFSSVHGPMTLDDFREAATAFKVNQVFEQMAARDEAEMVNAQWIRTLHNEPTFRFEAWASAPKVRQVKQRKQELSRRSAKGVRRGGNAEINDGLNDDERAAKRAALAAPAAALAAQRQAAAAVAAQQQQEQQLANVDELDALY